MHGVNQRTHNPWRHSRRPLFILAVFASIGLVYLSLSLSLSRFLFPRAASGNGRGVRRHTEAPFPPKPRHRILVAGCVRDGADILPLSLHKISAFCALLPGFVCDAFVYENDSNDGTEKVLDKAKSLAGRKGPLSSVNSLDYVSERSTGLGRMKSLERCRNLGLDQ